MDYNKLELQKIGVQLRNNNGIRSKTWYFFKAKRHLRDEINNQDMCVIRAT